ncbi:MAG: hypothetical protein ACTSP5_15605 [Candidatus Heimdallarchaeota archaeon]
MSEDEDIQETNDIEEIFESEQEVLEPLPVSFSEGKLFARATLWTTVIYSSTFELIGLIIGTIAFLIAAFANINLSDDTSSRYIFTILLILWEYWFISLIGVQLIFHRLKNFH